MNNRNWSFYFADMAQLKTLMLHYMLFCLFTRKLHLFALPLLWSSHHRNVCGGFIHILHKRPLELRDEQSRFWWWRWLRSLWSDVWAPVNLRSQNLFIFAINVHLDSNLLKHHWSPSSCGLLSFSCLLSALSHTEEWLQQKHGTVFSDLLISFTALFKC